MGCSSVGSHSSSSLPAAGGPELSTRWQQPGKTSRGDGGQTKMGSGFFGLVSVWLVFLFVFPRQTDLKLERSKELKAICQASAQSF